ncbi:MAG: serine protein kinase RIO [Candidatus Micrarchaeia archaeon]
MSIYNDEEDESLRKEYISKGKEKSTTNEFNEKTSIILSKFFNKGIIKKVDYIIARGKEADIYIAEAGGSEIVANEKFIILKLFRIETSSFFNIRDYIVGDPRFRKINRAKYSLINEWCKKEYRNLQIAIEAHVNAPKPFMFKKNILAMSLIENNGKPAPKLHDILLDNPQNVYNQILKSVSLLYNMELVHADLSEYNILIADKEVPYLIDFGQAVDIKHPNALQFLKRDITNISTYFSNKYNIETDPIKIIDKIIKGRD